MRCPKCGAFLEDNREICTMCGTNVRNYNNNNNSNNNFGNIFNNNNLTNNSFNNGNNNFNTQVNSFNNQNAQNNFNNNAFQGYNNSNNNAFGSGANNINNMPMNNNYNTKKEQYNNRFNDYKNVSYNDNLRSEDKDIFDFFSENKKVIKILGILLLIAFLSFIAYKYYDYRLKEENAKPVIINLYYEVDDSLQSVSGNSQSQVIYSKSGDKGSACSIVITYGSATEEDHVKSFFSNVKASLEPELDSNVAVVNDLDIYTSQTSSITLNDSLWYYLNIFYRKDRISNPTLLRYKYLTSVYKGYYYDITLINNSNDSACNASLDNFAKSLKFIDT